MAFAPNGSTGTVTYPHPGALNNLAQMTLAFVLNASASTFYDTLIQCQGANISGSGNSTGFAILHPAADPTALFLAYRNNSTSPEKVTQTGVITTGADTRVWVTYDGGQGTATNRLRLWLGGTEIVSWASDTADFPTDLGVNDQPLVLGSDGAGSLFSSTILSDVTLFIGRAITDPAVIAAHANSYSGGNFVRSGDIWIPAVRDLNDRFGLVGTTSGGVSVTTHPRIVMPYARQSARWTTGPASTYTLSAASGSYAVTGAAAALRADRKVSAAAGSYAITGTAATLSQRVLLATLRGSFAATTNATSYAETQTWTPGANSLVVAFVFVSATSPVAPPTVAGHGLTWSALTLGSHGPITLSAGSGRLDAYVAKTPGATPTSGAFTVSGYGASQTGAVIFVWEINSADLTGTALAAIVQSPTNSGTATSGSVTLSAAGNALNRPLSFFAHAANEATAPRANWTEPSSPVGDGSYASPNVGADTQMRTDAFETTASASWTTSSAWIGVALELKARSLLVAYTLDATTGGSYAVTGTAAILRVGHVVSATSGSYTVTGATATLRVGRKVQAASGALAVTGASASLRSVRTLAANAASYAISGTAAGLRRGYTAAAAGGVYATTGTAAALHATRLITAAAGSYAVTGTSAALRAGRTASATAGSYAISGQSATLIFSGAASTFTLDAQAGIYTVTGSTATLRRTYVFTLAAGSYLVTGQSSSMRAVRRTAAAAGAYAQAGVTARLAAFRRLAAGSDSYALNGASASFGLARALAANGGVYAVVGVDADLIASSESTFHEHQHVTGTLDLSADVTGTLDLLTVLTGTCETTTLLVGTMEL